MAAASGKWGSGIALEVVGHLLFGDTWCRFYRHTQHDIVAIGNTAIYASFVICKRCAISIYDGIVALRASLCSTREAIAKLYALNAWYRE